MGGRYKGKEFGELLRQTYKEKTCSRKQDQGDNQQKLLQKYS